MGRRSPVCLATLHVHHKPSVTHAAKTQFHSETAWLCYGLLQEGDSPARGGGVPRDGAFAASTPFGPFDFMDTSGRLVRMEMGGALAAVLAPGPSACCPPSPASAVSAAPATPAAPVSPGRVGASPAAAAFVPAAAPAAAAPADAPATAPAAATAPACGCTCAGVCVLSSGGRGFGAVGETPGGACECHGGGGSSGKGGGGEGGGPCGGRGPGTSGGGPGCGCCV